MCDNQSTCSVLDNAIENGKSKHLDVHWHFVRERVRMGDVKVTWVRSEDNVADIFTKPLGKIVCCSAMAPRCLRSGHDVVTALRWDVDAGLISQVVVCMTDLVCGLP
jgi:hypothetical protein